MTPTGWRPLAATALGLAVATVLLLPALYLSLPPLPLAAPVTLTGVAVVLALMARDTRRRIRRRPGARRLEPLAVARSAALAKAAAVAGAVLTGLYAGLATYTLGVRDTLAAARTDAPRAVAAALTAALVTAAALALQDACRTPPPPDPSGGDDPPPRLRSAP